MRETRRRGHVPTTRPAATPELVDGRPGLVLTAGLINGVDRRHSHVALLPLATQLRSGGRWPPTGSVPLTAVLGFGALAAPAALVGPRGRGPRGPAAGLLRLEPRGRLGRGVTRSAGRPADPRPGRAVAVLVECAITETIQDGVADEHRAGC